MTIDQMRAFVERQNWIFAKTYADRAPHEYMLQDKLVGAEEDYFDFVHTIFEKGMKMQFWHKENRYIYLDGHLYWVMDPTPEETTLINRSNVEDYEIVIFAKAGKSERRNA